MAIFARRGHYPWVILGGWINLSVTGNRGTLPKVIPEGGAPPPHPHPRARTMHSNAYFSLFSSLFFFGPPNRFVQIPRDLS